MKTFNNYLIGLLVGMAANKAAAQQPVEYEYVQPYARYYGTYLNGDHIFDTAEEAMAQVLSLWNRSEFRDAKIEATGPEKVDKNYTTHWYLPVRLSAYWVPVNRMMTEDRNISIWYNCPMAGGWDNYYDAGSNVQRCRRPVPVRSECDACDTKPNEPVPSAGNPIVLFNRIKRQVEMDYQSATGTLAFTRTYQSDTGKWTHNYDSYAIDYNKIDAQASPFKEYFLDIERNPRRCFSYIEMPAAYRLVLTRGNGRRERFGSAGYLPPSEINDRATPVLDPESNVVGWKISNAARQSTEEYALDGRLRSVKARGGKVTTLEYSTAETPPDIAPTPGLLVRVSDAFGSSLNFKYNSSGQMTSMIDPAGGIFMYTYDSIGNLTSVTYPDNKVRSYLYNEAKNLE